MKLKISNVFRIRRRANRKYKDTLFRSIFHDKKDLLSLYNAVNGTDYGNPEESSKRNDIGEGPGTGDRILSEARNTCRHFAEKSSGGA